MKHPVPDAALDADIATIAQKGAGKTYTNRGLVERLLDQQRRVVVLDPLNSWWGLKALANGKPGYPVAVIGGPNADVPLDPKAGEKLGAFIAAAKISVVIDVSELKRGELIRFSNDFLASLYRLNREPLWLVLEEADVFAPQQPMGDATMLLHQVDQIARRGRARGFRLWSITQRPAKLHKDILTQTSTLIMLRIRSPQDRAAAEAWIVGNAESAKAREISATLSSLPVGEGWVWSPDHDVLARVKFPPIRTLDTSATPQAGDAPRCVGKLASVDLGALREALTPEPTPPSGTSSVKPPVHRVEIVTAQQITEAEQRGYERGHDDGSAQVLKALSAIASDLSASVGAAKEACERSERLLSSFGSFVGNMASEPRARVATSASHQAVVRKPAAPAPKPKPSPEADGSLTGPQTHLLGSLAWWAAMGHQEPTRTQLAAFAGWTPKGSNLRNRLSELSTLGFVEYPRQGQVRLTPTGAAAAPKPDLGQTLLDSIRSILTGPQSAIFEALLAHGGEISRADLAAAVGWEPAGSNLRNRLSELSTLELVEYPARGSVQLQPWVTQ